MSFAAYAVDPDSWGLPCASFRVGSASILVRSPAVNAEVDPRQVGAGAAGLPPDPSVDRTCQKVRNGSPLDDAPTIPTPPALDTGAADGPAVGNGGGGTPGASSPFLKR